MFVFVYVEVIFKKVINIKIKLRGSAAGTLFLIFLFNNSKSDTFLSRDTFLFYNNNSSLGYLNNVY